MHTRVPACALHGRCSFQALVRGSFGAEASLSWYRLFGKTECQYNPVRTRAARTRKITAHMVGLQERMKASAVRCVWPVASVPPHIAALYP